MNNDLNKHKKSDAIKWVVVFVSILVLLGGMIAALIPLYSKDADVKEDVKATNEIITTETVVSNGIKLSMGEAVAASDGTISKTLTATVLPDDSNNKLVDWTVSWLYTDGTFEQSNTVSNYVTVSTASDGSNVATVTAHNAFADHPVLITVTTREGGLKATCIVKYVGLASSISIDTSSLNDGDVSANTITTLDINLSNVFGVVTDEYINDYANFTVSVNPVGIFKASHFISNNVVTNTVEVSVSLIEITDQCNISAKIENGKLVLTSTNSITSYYINNSVVDDGGTGLGGSTDITTYLSGAENCHWEITVTDTYSGISTTISVGIYSENTSVSVSEGDIVF